MNPSGGVFQLPKGRRFTVQFLQILLIVAHLAYRNTVQLIWKQQTICGTSFHFCRQRLNSEHWYTFGKVWTNFYYNFTIFSVPTTGEINAFQKSMQVPKYKDNIHSNIENGNVARNMGLKFLFSGNFWDGKPSRGLGNTGRSAMSCEESNISEQTI